MDALEQQQAEKFPSARTGSTVIYLLDILTTSFITWAELLRRAEGSLRRGSTLQQLEALTRLVPELYPQGQGNCQHYAVQATT